MLKERNFTVKEIISAIKSPDKIVEKGVGVKHFFKQMQNHILRIVVKEGKTSYTVITMFYGRRLKTHK
ncbi:MAG: hypothetical protein RBG13Loki_1609 [Promethearchaeota archaeon CR_4]|nr:MAG: hypothetical protein RBG13Loki_1609 [Candidatus Lokiarchaeota archaeon CR_4]